MHKGITYYNQQFYRDKKEEARLCYTSSYFHITKLPHLTLRGFQTGVLFLTAPNNFQPMRTEDYRLADELQLNLDEKLYTILKISTRYIGQSSKIKFCIKSMIYLTG